jgi:hypothetical protein
MVGPWVVVYTTVYFGVGIASSFGAEFPYCPILGMFVIEEFNKRISRIPVGALGVGRGGARGCNDLLSVSLEGSFLWSLEDIGCRVVVLLSVT